MSKNSHYFNPITVIKKIDFYGKPVPGFTIDGEDTVQTAIGGVLSAITMFVTVAFGLFKLQHLVRYYNPAINTFELINALEDGQVFDPVSEGWTMAFGLEDYTTKEIKDDKKIIKWLVRYLVYENSEIVEQRVMPLHACTEYDFAQF